MTSIGSRDMGDLSFVEHEEKDHRPDTPLGFVKSEPLISMLKVVRMPPPMLGGARTGTGERTNAGKTPIAETASSEKKLAAARLTLGLAELVLHRVTDIKALDDPQVQEGLEEVYRFLLDCEHLRAMRQL